MIHISVNGETMAVDAGTNLSDLIATLNLTGKRLAIEVNESIVARSLHESFVVSENDKLEIIHAVGGG